MSVLRSRFLIGMLNFSINIWLSFLASAIFTTFTCSSVSAWKCKIFVKFEKYTFFPKHFPKFWSENQLTHKFNRFFLFFNQHNTFKTETKFDFILKTITSFGKSLVAHNTIHMVNNLLKNLKQFLPLLSLA